MFLFKLLCFLSLAQTIFTLTCKTSNFGTFENSSVTLKYSDDYMTRCPSSTKWCVRLSGMYKQASMNYSIAGDFSGCQGDEPIFNRLQASCEEAGCRNTHGMTLCCCNEDLCNGTEQFMLFISFLTVMIIVLI